MLIAAGVKLMLWVRSSWVAVQGCVAHVSGIFFLAAGAATAGATSSTAAGMSEADTGPAVVTVMKSTVT